jgi:UDP-glucose 4-epimerase
MQIAITGAAGRLGKVVVEDLLHEGHTLVGIDRLAPAELMANSNVFYVQVDTTCYEALEDAMGGCNAIIHLAAHPSPHGYPDHQIHNENVVSSYNVLSAAAALGISRVCLASSVNAIGGAFSRAPRYDYFPVDEQHPTYAEDPYSLSKWICEAQGDMFARRDPGMTIASLRFHALVHDYEDGVRIASNRGDASVRDLWGYTSFESAARACLLAITAEFHGHEVFYIVAPRTASSASSAELCEAFYPDVEIRSTLEGHRSFFDSSKASRLLHWEHDTSSAGGVP